MRRPTIRDCVVEWLELQRARVREATWLDNGVKAGRYVLPALGDVPVCQFEARHLVRLYRDMRTRGLSLRTVRYAHQIVHHALQHAVGRQLISANPAPGARPGSRASRPPASLAPAELRRFLEAARTSEHAALWFLLAGTGLRPSEALGLRWEQLALERGVVRIDSALRMLPGGRFQRSLLPHSRHRREVALSKPVLGTLREHRARQHRLRQAAGNGWEQHDLVFTNARGGPLRWGTVSRGHFKSLLELAGLPPVSAYSLRHACVAALLQQGIALDVISRQVGYAKLGRLLDDRGMLEAGNRANRPGSGPGGSATACWSGSFEDPDPAIDQGTRSFNS